MLLFLDQGLDLQKKEKNITVRVLAVSLVAEVMIPRTVLRIT